jgi:hypothetical protein
MSAPAIAAAIALESAAVWRLALSGSSTGALLVFLALHAAASALLALMLLPLLPARLRTPRTAVLALLFALAFFMPGLGAIALLLAVLAMRLAPVQVPVETFRLAAPPQFELSIPEPARRFRGLSVRQLLIDVNATAVLRSRALNAIAAKPARIAGDLLRRLLRDPVEDLRLVAYGLLDRQEKALRARIETQSRHLATLEASPLGRITLPGRIEPIDLDATRGELHRQLAELNHELVYQSLVQGDVREHTLAQAEHHVEAALAADPHDAGLRHLRARIRLEQGDGPASREDLLEAAELGLPAQRVRPYLAEMAFSRRDWQAVREEMRRIDPASVTPRMAALVRYWHAAPARPALAPSSAASPAGDPT